MIPIAKPLMGGEEAEAAGRYLVCFAKEEVGA